VSGFGVLGNRTLRRSLRELLSDRQAPVWDAHFVEDAFLVLHNRLLDDGYPEAVVVGNLTLTDGRTLAVWWSGREELEVPPDIGVVAARFEVRHGALHFYDQLVIEGVTAIPPSKALGFFVQRDVLLNLPAARRFSADQLQGALRRLRRELLNRGYRQASVRLKDQSIDPATGRVRVTIAVFEGPRHVVRHLHLAEEPAVPKPAVESPPLASDQPFSLLWEQDAAQAINLQLQRQGYPDARTQIREVGRSASEGRVELDLAAEVQPGEQVELGEVRFEGGGRTKPSFLQRRVRLEGPWLDRVEADRARERLTRLGSFRFVDLRLEPESGPRRDVVYALTEGERYELSLIGGYGSYDQLFGGAEFEHFNLWGVGHNTRVKVVQSFKSTHGLYTYTVPEFLAPDLDLFGTVDGFQREELTFDRQEIKLALGVRRLFPRVGQQLGLRYSYEFLDAQTAAVGNAATRAAGLIADWQLDRRDNPLLPRQGYRIYANTEFANRALGGESDYVRVEVGASAHHSLARGLVVHVGLMQGLVASANRQTLLPFNKRLFPGGENSVRGYQQGGASPLDANGDQLGAEAALQGNLELEQRLTRAFSIVGFVDGVGVTPRIESYPFDEVLWSAGAGLRWNTIIGPVRLEYGHNLNPRAADPGGTLHFSIGFPF
jgi:outer membrane protein assembly complex protein YaeT